MISKFEHLSWSFSQSPGQLETVACLLKGPGLEELPLKHLKCSQTIRVSETIYYILESTFLGKSFVLLVSKPLNARCRGHFSL